MSEFDKSFISNFEINDLTEEEINNLRIQRNEIDKILYSYETNKTDIQSVKINFMWVNILKSNMVIISLIIKYYQQIPFII